MASSCQSSTPMSRDTSISLSNKNHTLRSTQDSVWWRTKEEAYTQQWVDTGHRLMMMMMMVINILLHSMGDFDDDDIDDEGHKYP